MKKSIPKPDGTVEVVEGTPEEIAEYERRVRQEPVKEQVKKPGLLTEDDQTRQLMDLLDEVMKQRYASRPHGRMQHDPGCDIITAQRGWWSVIPPRCTCGYYTYPQPQILGPDTQPYTRNSRYNFVATCGRCGKATVGARSEDVCDCPSEGIFDVTRWTIVSVS